MLENNLHIVFWVMACVHSVTQAEHTRSESSFPWKLVKCRPLAVIYGSAPFQRWSTTEVKNKRVRLMPQFQKVFFFFMKALLDSVF